MAKVMVFNPRGRARAPRKGAEKIASRRFGAGAGVYRPSFAHGHETSDSVRERLVRYKIAKPTSGKRVLLNSGEAAAADATNPKKKRTKRASGKKGAAKAKPAAKKGKAKAAKKPKVARKAKAPKKAAKKAKKATKAKSPKPGKAKAKAKKKGKARRNSAPVSTVDIDGVGSLVLAKSNPRGKQRRSAKGKFARSAKPSVTPAKARQILKDGFVTGPDGKRRTLTAKQKKYFGWAAGGYQESKRGKRKGKSASAASAKATKGKTAKKAKSKRSKMAKKKRAKKAVTKAAKKAKPAKRKSAKKAGSKRGKKKAAAKKRKASKKTKARKAPAKRKAKSKSKSRGVRKAARRGKAKSKKGGRKAARRNDESMPLANKPKRRKAKKARKTRRNDQPLTEKQLQELAKKLAPKYRAAQTAAQKKKAQETAQRAAIAEVAARLGVPAPAVGPVSTMAKDLAQRVSDSNLGLKVSEKEIKRLLAGIPKPAEAVSVDQAIAKMASAIEKIAGKTASRRSSSRRGKSRKSGSKKRSRKSTKSKAKRNGKRRSSKKSTVLAKASKKRGKKKTARKAKSKAKKTAGRKAGRRKAKGKKGGRKGKVRRNAGFDMVRRIPGASYVEDYASNLKEVGVNYLPGGLAGLVGAYGIPSLAFQFMPANLQSYNQGWWGVLTSAIGVGVAAGLTGVVASKVQPGSARKQTIGAVLGGSLAIATRVISALTAPSNPIRRAIGTDSSRLADYAGMRDLYAPDYLGDHPLVLANAADSLVDLDYGQPGDQIGMTPDEGISDFVAPMLIQPGQSGKAYAPMSDFAAPAMDDLVAAGMGQAWPGTVDNTLQLSGAVPVTDFALGDGADEMGPSDVDDGCDLSDFVEVNGPQSYHQGR